MGLFKSVEKFRSLEEDLKKRDSKIKEELLSKFVNLKYQMQEVEAGYINRTYIKLGEDPAEKVKVYYPILDLAEGFSKSEDMFFRNCANEIVHTYTLTNSEGSKVQIEERATFVWGIYEESEFFMKVIPNIASEGINYKINISESSYKFYREFTYQEMIERIVGSKDVIFATDKVLLTDQEAYEKYIRALGKVEDIVSLKDLVTSSQEKIQITPTLIAEVSIKQDEKKEIVWYQIGNNQVCVRFNIPYTLSSVTLHTKTTDGVSLGVQKFKHSQFNEGFKDKLTLSEVFQRMKK